MDKGSCGESQHEKGRRFACDHLRAASYPGLTSE